MRIVVGHSEDPHAGAAVAAVIRQVEASLDGELPAGALLYTCIDIDHQQILDGIQKHWPGLPLVGCTTDGECSSVLQFAEDSIVLTLFVGDDLDLRVGLGTEVRQDLDAAAQHAAQQVARDGAPPSLVIAVPESIGVSGAEIVAKLNLHLPEESIVVGGTAGDQWRFTETRQFFGGRVLTDTLPLMAFGPGLRVSVGVASGWEPLGQMGRVTRADGSVVHEIDGQPAIDFLHKNVGVHADVSPEFPFAVFEDSGSDAYYLRAPMTLDPDSGHIVFAGDVPEGAYVRVSEAGPDQILDGARQAVATAVERYEGTGARALLIFSCAARKQVLGTRCAEEIGLLQSALTQHLDAAGFYTYGEIAPIRQGSPARFHNETVVAALVGE